MSPRVSVLLPVYNGDRFLADAIASILRQSFSDFELIILNDGSSDRSLNVCQSFADRRVRIVSRQENLGLVATLNEGLVLAQGEYVARMDCDDVSLPDRLARQVAFLDAHRQVGLCGTWYREQGRWFSKVTSCAESHERIRCGTLFNPVVGHPTVMFRRSSFAAHGLSYDPAYPHAEDYELWSRCLQHFQLANIPQVLLLYRVHGGQVTREGMSVQMASSGRVRRRLLHELGIHPTDEEFQIHQSLSALGRPYVNDFMALPARERLAKIDQWLSRLKQANDASRLYPEPDFSRLLVERWLGAGVLQFLCTGSLSSRLLRPPEFARQMDGSSRHAFCFLVDQLRSLSRSRICPAWLALSRVPR